MEFFYMRYKMLLLVGLVRMVSAIGASKVVEVYMVTQTITFSLPWNSPNVKWRSNVIITEILETDMNMESISKTVIEPESQPLQGDEPQVEIPTQDDGCYVPEKRSHQWDNVEYGDLLDGVGVDVSQDWESDFIESFFRWSGSEDGRPDKDDILVESDYEMDEPHVEPTNENNVNINIGFGKFFEGSSCNNESDYRDSDELESRDSERELPKRMRTRDEFNPRMDMDRNDNEVQKVREGRAQQKNVQRTTNGTVH
ncbi:hypothetical protein Fot_23739 [Forsythia ovata]|uniref:Uncharacterized protein n=1 Tax=Forsythia ovata TaxID=205694 RepID=A0ABD1U482_9LAMI